jgi:uncharacterized damage-inducible protein DinB
MPGVRDARAWKADRALLRQEHEALVQVARDLTADQLDHRDAKGEYRALDLLFGVATHDVYHTGQIQLMKRLYRDAHDPVTA